uniref:Large ribosomal subunit protein bL33c n=1 Tax=Bulboplastis apyrenoidosa TaxID=1070855 RepID=A0A1Y9TM88_9RHOD|nr:50S ribosomal protein L33 [Bulboplastis apyrenoidosa]ARO90757.1 50S ribosomal protein L33 [Bulboplastis apyrenoidosa]
MGKSKGTRIVINLECISCVRFDNQKRRTAGIFRYVTEKNRRNTTNRLEIKKYCPYCDTHTDFKEIK